MVCVSGLGASASAARFWRIGVLAAAGAIGTVSQAEAALFYWSNSDPGYYYSRPVPMAPPRRPKANHYQAKKIEAPGKESAKPQGPLIIAISIEKQNLRVYDANGFFAEAPVSTGMKGHPTPMGVFSVIQKHRLHHSNIYSNAPMPYMQRITWSGVAIHAGVLPGYPASHGCIRMPTAFAIKMWNWTRMGARVFITPGEVTPAGFSHPLLVAQKVSPPPNAGEPQADAPPPAKSDKASDAGMPAISAARLELRSTVGHDDAAKPVIDEAPAALREQTRTADASGGARKGNPAATMSDATGGGAPPSETAKADDLQPVTPKPDAATTTVMTDISADVPLEKNSASPQHTEQPAASKPDPAAITVPKRAGQIAVFVSRKDSKLYVRQNFAPLFEVPVTIAPSDRPLGTHVFTAQVDKGDANIVHWSVVSLPALVRHAERRDEDERGSHRRKMPGAVEIKPMPLPDDPAEALDRLSIPADAMARITAAISTGGSIIVSDQGIGAGETGEGTDFIVSLR